MSALPAWSVAAALLASLILILILLVIRLAVELRRRRGHRPLLLDLQLDDEASVEKIMARALDEIAGWVPGQAYHAYWLSAEGDALRLVASKVAAGDPAVTPDYSGLVMDDTPLVPLSLTAEDRRDKPTVAGSGTERRLELPLGRELVVRIFLQRKQEVPALLLHQLAEASRVYAPLMLALHQWFKAREAGAMASGLRDSTQAALDTTLHAERGAELLLRIGGQVIEAQEACAVLAGPQGAVLLSETEEGRTIAQRILQDEVVALTILPDHPDIVSGSDLGPLGQGYRACVRVPLWVRGEPVGCFFYFLEQVPQLDAYLTTVLHTLGERTAHLLAGQLQLEAASESYAKTLRVLVDAMDGLSPYTQGHSDRLARHARLIAQELRLPEPEVETVAMAAYFHEVGMIAMDSRVILRPGRLSKDEYEQMKNHAEVGAQLVGVIRTPLPLGPMVAHHHERWDGHGYPAGLAGETIPLGARIIAAVDLLDAKTTSRAYREALPFNRALEDIKAASGRHLDPTVVDALLAALGRERHEARFGLPMAPCWELKQLPEHVCSGCPNRVATAVRCWERPENLCSRHGDRCESCMVYTEATSRRESIAH